MGENKSIIGEAILVTANMVICRSPAILIDVTISGDGANGDCDVYDGENTFGEKKAHLEVLSGTSFSFKPPCGVRINNGIYVVVNAATTNVTITFIALERHE